MPVLERLAQDLRAIPELIVKTGALLAPYTRFAIGGEAALFCDTANPEAFTSALSLVKRSGLPSMVIGGGTNLVVSDSGFDGIVLRFTGATIRREGNVLHAQSGALLQSVVDTANGFGLEGMQTLTGIPGFLGGALYGNAGAYGHSIQEVAESVIFTDGKETRTFANEQCDFQYRESLFKRRKEWIILAATLRFVPGDRGALLEKSAEIRAIRDEKYPPSMKCAGSIFKNVFFAELPAAVQAEVPPAMVREGKVPSAWFLEQAGVKGRRRGDIQVAGYHANLIYNDGRGTASDLVAVIEDCKASVRQRFGFDLQEEIQYVGFAPVPV